MDVQPGMRWRLLAVLGLSLGDDMVANPQRWHVLTGRSDGDNPFAGRDTVSPAALRSAATAVRC